MSNSKKSSGENRCRNTSGNRGGRGKRENWRNRSTDGNAERPTGGLPGGRRPHPFHARSASSSNDQSDSAGRPKNRKHQSRDGDRRPPHRNDDQQNPRKIRQMGFKFLQELLMKEDLEAVVLSLSNDRKGFKELLETRQVSNDVIVLILRLLCKISECSFRSAKVGLFESALRSAFSDNVIRYVSTIAIQSDHDKRFNSEFWKDTDQFWNNIIQISRTMQDLIPTTSCDVTSKLLKAVKLYIPIIETTHSIHISDTIKNEIEELFVIVEKCAKEVERKKEIHPALSAEEELEPPDDFRAISVYPDAMEVIHPESPFLRPNVTRGPYRDVGHYLDVQFRLLREDFVAPLRKAICRYMKNPKDKLDDVKIYNPIRFLNMETVTEQKCFRIQYDFSTKKRTFVYENSRRFMFGALLCFTSDNFKTVLFAKVAKRDVKDLLEKGQLIVGFSEDVDLPENLYDLQYVMVESTVYFEPYYRVLNVLKTMQPENFPMERYIISVQTTTQPPNYLLKIDPQFYTIENETFFPLDWGERQFYGLNDSQNSAFKAALTREFVIIQGPPGTGKTFLGLKIARTLLHNKSVWYSNTPILVICYTNHALDQFLEGLLPVTQDILRVGGQSKNEKLDKYNIRNKRFKVACGPAIAQRRHEVQSIIQEIASIDHSLSEIEKNISVVEFDVFRNVIPNFAGSWFDTAKSEDILRWLFSGGEVNYRNLRIDDQAEAIAGPSPQMNEGADAIAKEEEEDIDNTDNLFEDDVLFDNIKLTGVRELVSLKSLSTKIDILKRELLSIRDDNEMHVWDKRHHIDCLNFEIYRTEGELEYLQMRLAEGKNSTAAPQFLNLMNPHYMSHDDRWQMYFHWLGIYVAKLRERKEAVSIGFRKVYSLYTEMRDIEDAQVMKSSLVVGMTTTGAARLQSVLQSLKSPIVIVEEAAEVLEAHIISSLTPHCRHLILIGDHQQLKPSTANFKIETKYRLGISLFERMVINRIQCHTLTVQHRMRPEISCLIRPSIYPVLEDHESVFHRPQILGIENCIYFLDHNEQEQICKDNSKKNVHEAKFLIRLARHLILNGYKPEDITILAAYLGQMFEMQREKKLYSNLLQNVRIAVLDNYQGEESNIILLSLVRSNSNNKIGFLKIENRVCVALSRARNGFYMMGNMSLLCDNSEIWPKIRDSLKNQDAIGPYLTFRCQVHRHKITHVKKAEDFNSFPEGGCDLMCEAKLGCGHFCKRLCHVEDMEHVFYKCREDCVNLLCDDDPTHVCRKRCHEECGPCTYPVKRDLQCGHSVMIACHVDPLAHKCTVLVDTKLPCEHEAQKPCHEDAETFSCPHPCDSRVEPCGHACRLSCHIRNDPDHLEYKCTKPCDRYRKGCSLQNDEAHLCPRMCHEECPNCEVEVLKRRSRCNHMSKTPCNLDADLKECQKPCQKLLPCGHKCKRKCEEPCENCKEKVKKIVPICKHEINIECYIEPDRKYCKGKCPRLLPCGHVCLNKCNEECTEKCKVIIDCAIPSPCGHVIKKIKCFLKDNEDSKILLQRCSEPCGVKLKCNHICQGTCGECSQGRIHVKCREKCGVPLVCNHECTIPCRQACKPCLKPCEYRCKHSKCKRNCGDPCTFCKEPCGRRCEHQQCTKKCGQPCNVPPCSKPCMKMLKCGHRCVGFCGDRCPVLCKICDKEELTEVFLGNEDEEDAIYVMLEDCGHIFESGDMERWLKMDENVIKAKVCPKCKTTIKTTTRYSNYTRRTLMDITKVKAQFYGNEAENDKERQSIGEDLTKLKCQVSLLNFPECLLSAIHHLIQRLSISKGRRRQAINKMDLSAIKSKMQFLEAVVKIFVDLKQELKNTMSKSTTHRPTVLLVTILKNCEKQVSFIVAAVMRDEDSITDQEIEDITLEMNRLTRWSQFERIKVSSSGITYRTKDKVEQQILEIEGLLNTPTRFSSNSDEILKSVLKTLNELTASPIQISEAERIAIVKAIGLKPGHWFKCRNGHPYVITECGGAMQVSKCNDCGVDIGGRNHHLLPEQYIATEIDGARHAAWSEQANMGNYMI